MAVDEPAGKEVEALDLAGGRGFREHPRHLLASLGAVESRAGAPPQRVQPGIKFPLQAIDDQRIQSLEALLVEQLVKAVLSLDQEMQAPFAVAEVEREQKLGPAREIVDRYLRYCAVADCEQEFGPAREVLERSLARRGVVHGLVDEPLALGPYVDDLAHHARERRLRRLTAQLHDQLRHKGAHRSELESVIAFVGETGIARDLDVDLLAPCADLIGPDWFIERHHDQFHHQLADVRPRALDDVPDPADLVVELGDPAQFVGDRLRAGGYPIWLRARSRRSRERGGGRRRPRVPDPARYRQGGDR